MGYSDWFHFDFDSIRRETAKSFEIVTTAGKIYSIPKSKVADREDYKAGDRNGTMSIPEWLAKEKGMINGPTH